MPSVTAKPGNGEPEELFTVTEAAFEYGLTTECLTHWIATGDLAPVDTRDGQPVYRESDIGRLIGGDHTPFIP